MTVPESRPPWCRALEDVLRIERVGDATFTAQLEGFGGVTLGCATLAAALTCAERSLHSLHTYFLRPVPPGAVVELAVERLRDGRRFAHRRVQIRMDDRLLCELVASFAAPGGGTEYQDAVVAPATPQPDDLPTEEEVGDYHSHFSVARKLAGHFEPIGYASLDQVLWLHRDRFWDDWWLLSTESDVAHAGRAFTRRVLHARDGQLVASMAQEQLIPDAIGPP